MRNRSLSRSLQKDPMFGKLLIIAQQRNEISMKEVLKYSLSPIPWSLALPDGGLVKTVKSKLLNLVEDGIPLTEEFPSNSCIIYDGMVILQQVDAVKLTTFGDLSDTVISRITSRPRTTVDTIYFVTDQYRENSIKSYERSRRSQSGTIRMKIERRDQRLPKQFQKYLRDAENKSDVISFLFRDWSSNQEYMELLRNRKLYINVGNYFYKIQVLNNQIIHDEVLELRTNQEEADTKVFLCCQHAAESGYESSCIYTVDSDIPLYALYFADKISIDMYVLIGTKNKKRLLNISSIRDIIGDDCALAMPAFHSFTGNDYTSAFHSIGKSKGYKLLKESQLYQQAFSNFGDSFTFDVSIFPTIQQFVCDMYGLKTCSTTDEARYVKFCSSKTRIPEPQRLPPTSDALLCHCKRVSYVTAIIKRSLQLSPVIPPPDGHGWKIQDDGPLEIDWMLRKPAPDFVLEMVVCACQRNQCNSNVCQCCAHGIKCTDLCNCRSCENQYDSDNENSDIDDEYDDDDQSDDDEILNEEDSDIGNESEDVFSDDSDF